MKRNPFKFYRLTSKKVLRNKEELKFQYGIEFNTKHKFWYIKEFRMVPELLSYLDYRNDPDLIDLFQIEEIDTGISKTGTKFPQHTAHQAIFDGYDYYWYDLFVYDDFCEMKKEIPQSQWGVCAQDEYLGEFQDEELGEFGDD